MSKASTRLVAVSLTVIAAALPSSPVQPKAWGQTVGLLSDPPHPHPPAHDVAISPDGRFAVVQGAVTTGGVFGGEGGIGFFSLDDGSEIARFPMTAPAAPIPPVRSVAVSADGRRVVATSAEGVAVFDTSGSSPLLLSQVSHPAVHDLAISADGRFAVVRAAVSSGGIFGGMGGVAFFSLDDGAEIARFPMTAPAAPIPAVRSVAVSADGRRVVATAADAVAIFDTGGASPVLLQHVAHPAAHDLAISPDGRFAVVRAAVTFGGVFGGLGGVTFFDLDDGSEVFRHPMTAPAAPIPPVRSVAVSADGRRVVATAANAVAVFDTSGAVPVVLADLAQPAAHDLAISPDGRFAVVRAAVTGGGALGGTGGVAFFDLDDGTETAAFPLAAPAAPIPPVRTVAVSGDGSRVVATAADGIAVFATAGATVVPLGQLAHPAAHDLAISPDGRYAVVRAAVTTGGALGGEGGVSFVALEGGEEVFRFAMTAPAAPIAPVRSVAISADGSRVVATAADAVALFAVSPPLGPFAEIERVSVADDGRQSDGSSLSPALSGDGRHVAFLSSATDLVAQPELHSFFGVYVRDTGGEGTEQINVGLGGLIGPSRAALSADGRYVAFLALVGGCLTPSVFPLTPLCVYVRDRVTGTSELISVAGDGTPGNAGAFSPAISAGGRYVAFTSGATNLAPGTADAVVRVFLRDRAAGTTELVGVGAGGAPANGASFSPAVSADGCVVAFASEATNLAAGADTPLRRVYVRDRCAGTTEAVSVDFAGRPDHGDEPSISADGRFVAFVSEIPLTGLILDFDGPRVFVRDRLAGTTELGHFAIARQPAISSDGGWLAFRSSSANVVPGVDAGRFHVYVHERASGETSLASHAASGEPGDADSAHPSLALRAGAVAFESAATNLVAGDTNGADDVFVARRVPAPGAEQPAANVALLPNLVDAREVRVESPPGTRLADVRSVGYPSFDGAPATVSFPAGFLAFQVEDLGAGAATTVELHLPPGVEPTTYWKHGPTPDDPAPHWYEFLFDGETGAVLAGERVTLHFVDGRRGDDDLVADGVVRDAGGPAAPPAGPTPECVAGATTLCLNGGRFAVEIDWAAPQGTSGPGRAEPLTDDTGTFWFFDPDNVEVVIKVLDACGPFDRFWVFAGGLTDVATEIRVTDTVAGVVRTFRNPQGTAFQPIQATDAFATCAAGSAVRASAREVARTGRRRQPLTTAPLRLADERFEVFVTWRTSQGTSGSGQPERLTGDSGTFWFFDPDNVEVVIKVLDACGPFDRFWVFAAGLTDVEVEITVLDTDTDTARVYRNPLGVPFQPLQDTGAFATCP